MRRHPFATGFLIVFTVGLIFIVCFWVASRFGMMDNLVTGGGDKVVVLEVEGVIVKSRPFIEQLKKYKKSDDVKAVVVRINSPGGSVAPSQEIYEEIVKCRESKIVVASMGSVAASGGYYIASAAQAIYANPGSITGSIGVIIESANIRELLDKIGLASVVIKSGKYKDILSPTRDVRDDEKLLIQGVIDTIHRQFIDAVAAGRDLPREKIAEIADGRIFSGEQAKGLGLVDQLGNLQDAIEGAAEMAGIAGEPVVVYLEKKRPSIWEFLIQGSLARARDYLASQEYGARYLMRSSGSAGTGEVDAQWQ